MNDPSDITKTTVSSAGEKKTMSLTFNSLSIIKITASVIVIGLAFWLGYFIGHHGKLVTTKSLGTISGRGEFARGGGLGTVTAISSSSITVQNSRSGQSSTYAITSSTEISDDGQSASASSIAQGETVIVVPSSSNSSDASRILVNPSFGGYGGGGGFGGSSSGSSTTE